MAVTSEQKSILIVDDTPINLGVISGALKDSFNTKVATNGEKALAIASAEEKPDLILLDVMMPGMDGYEVCRRLKANPATQNIPVIFLTGQTGAEDETKGFEVGAVDYIHKPFSAAIVKVRVGLHLMLRQAHETIAQQLVAINNELEMARQIQLSILPSDTPKLGGLEIVARYIPMTSVAGDFYDFIVVDEKHVGVLIADVSGHGLPAALIASIASGFADRAVRTCIRSWEGLVRVESGAVRQVPAKFCDGGVRFRGSGKKFHDLRRCGASAVTALAQFFRNSVRGIRKRIGARPISRRNLLRCDLAA